MVCEYDDPSCSCISEIFSEKELPLIKIAENKESSDNPFCRICFDGEERGELISPCRCKGTNRFVHESCLRIWLSLTTNNYYKRRCYVCSRLYDKEYIEEPIMKPRFSRCFVYTFFVLNFIYVTSVFYIFITFVPFHISRICIPVLLFIPYIATFFLHENTTINIKKSLGCICLSLTLLTISSFALSTSYIIPLIIYYIPMNLLYLYQLLCICYDSF